MANIVLDFNDRLGRTVELIADPVAAFITEADECHIAPYRHIHASVAIEVLNLCLDLQIGPNELRAIAAERERKE